MMNTLTLDNAAIMEAVVARLGDDFNKQTERYLVQAAAWLKDGMRDHLRGQVDQMLANLFHVKSAQDTAEGRYK